MNNLAIIFDEFSFYNPVRQTFFFLALLIALNILCLCITRLKCSKLNIWTWCKYIIPGCLICVLAYIIEKILVVDNLGIIINALSFFSIFMLGIYVCGLGLKKCKITDSGNLYTIKIFDAELSSECFGENTTESEMVVFPEKQESVSFVAELISKFSKETFSRKIERVRKLCIDVSCCDISTDSLVEAYELLLFKGQIPEGFSIELKKNEFCLVLGK